MAVHKPKGVDAINECGIQIDTSQIPKFRCCELAEAAIRLTELVFSRPGEEEKYQAWLKEYRAKKAAKKEG